MVILLSRDFFSLMGQELATLGYLGLRPWKMSLSAWLSYGGHLISEESVKNIAPAVTM